jgi:hypothetical protein
MERADLQPASLREGPRSTADTHVHEPKQGKRWTWARGFLRLWLVVSAIYVACVVMMLSPDRFRPLITPQSSYGVDFDGGTTRTFDTGKPPSLLRADVTTAWTEAAKVLEGNGRRSEAADILRHMDERTTELIVDLTRRNEDRIKRAYDALWIALLPPALLLAVGALVGWIARGFQG